jgi:hypothetical protein
MNVFVKQKLKINRKNYFVIFADLIDEAQLL